MQSRNLNFGCGKRFSEHWVNIDFASESPMVQRVNLLAGFPFPDSSFDAVYSSHVLEHFDRSAAAFLLSESKRVLKPKGVVRVVVPDLQASCTEYLRILRMPDGREKRRLYPWIMIELLDQMVRMTRTGEMGAFKERAMLGDDDDLKKYIQSRCENSPWKVISPIGVLPKLRSLNMHKLATKLSYWYLKLWAAFIPESLRKLVLVETEIGERHRWMYDEYGLKLALEEIGFEEIEPRDFNQSQIPDFNSYCLDCNADGQPYKRNSLYMEALK
jgi:predicted SAM-dependent methyltransferase